MMKRIFFILIMLFPLCFVACRSREPEAAFRVGMESFPTNLDPRFPSDAYSSKVNGLVFRGLFKLDEKLNLVPDLLEKFEVVSPTQLRFHLKSGVRFHDGTVLSAEDVLYTFRSILKPGSKSPLVSSFRRVQRMELLDSRTFDLYLREPFAPFLTSLTLGIVPEEADQDSNLPFSERPVGSGPFRFVEQKKGQWILLKAFSDYVGEPPQVPSLKIEAVLDDTTRVLKLLRGELDLVQNAVPLVMSSWLREKAGIKMVSEKGINYVYLGFNLQDPLLSKRPIREAIALALDRDTLLQFQLQGLARPATGILAPENPFYESDVVRWPYDPARAKQVLDEAGYPDPDGDGPLKRFTITYKTSNKRDRVVLARAIGAYLEAVGIGVELKPYEWGTFFRDIRTGNFQMFSSTWVGVTDPDILYQAFHSAMRPPEGVNRGGYANPEVDRWLELARAESEPEIRQKYYSEVQKVLSRDLPYVSLWYEDNVAFLRGDWQDYAVRPDASLWGLLGVRKP